VEDQLEETEMDFNQTRARLESRCDKASLRYLCNRERIVALQNKVARQSAALQSHADRIEDQTHRLDSQKARIEALEQWILGHGPHPGPPPTPLPLAPPDKFIGAKPVGPDGDFHVRPWLDSMETWYRAQPHLKVENWLPTALSYMDHSGRTTWSTALLPALAAKHKVEHPELPFVPTWDGFKLAMTDRFGGQASKVAKSKLKDGKCKYASSMHEYSSRFRALVDKANEVSDSESVIPPKEQARLFLAGLPRELRFFIISATPADGFETLADCEQYCTLKQTQYNEAAAQDPAPKPASTFRPGQPFRPRRRSRSPPRGKDRNTGQHKRNRPNNPSSRPGGSSPKPPRPPGRGERPPSGDQMTCAYCKKPGHHINDCRMRPRRPSSSSPAQDASRSAPKIGDKKGF
jgi:hypothetical protein